MSWKLVGVAAMALALGACGTNSRDRTTGGAAAGAATGAGIGALGGPVGALAGAAIGGGAGAITGAATSPREVNLGTPPWSNPEARVPGVDRDGRGTRGAARHASVRQAQQALNDRGFDAGTVDGQWGPRTASAVTAFQRANNIAPSGRLNGRTMEALNISGDSRTGSGADRDRAYMGGGRVGDAPGAAMPPARSDGMGMGNSGMGNNSMGSTGTPPGTATTGTGGTTAPGSSAPSAPR